jgi:chromosome segregation ATPase
MCASKPMAIRALVITSLWLGCSAAFAQAANTREQELIRRLRQQVQQLQAEQATAQQAAQTAQAALAAKTKEQSTAQAAQSALERQLQTARGEASRLRSTSTTTATQLSDAAKAAEALRAEREQLAERLQQAQGQLEQGRRGAEQLRGDVAQRARALAERERLFTELQSRHSTQAEGLNACMANNQSLHALGNELLARYAGKGFGDVLAVNEPFLQFKRVELENLVQGYQDKLDAQALKPGATGAARAP